MNKLFNKFLYFFRKPRNNQVKSEEQVKSQKSKVKSEEQSKIQNPKSKIGTPHYRRIQTVYAILDHAPEGLTYNQLIDHVREVTGQGCSRKLISKWKSNQVKSQKSKVKSQK